VELGSLDDEAEELPVVDGEGLWLCPSALLAGALVEGLAQDFVEETPFLFVGANDLKRNSRA
jgi:hypothetical protein